MNKNTRTMRHLVVAATLLVAAGAAAAGVATHRAPALHARVTVLSAAPAAMADLPEIIVYAPAELAEVIVYAPRAVAKATASRRHDLGDVLANAGGAAGIQVVTSRYQVDVTGIRVA